MTPEEWKAHIHDWQQSGGKEGRPADPTAQADEGGGMTGALGQAWAGVKGAGREIATQGGFAKDFAQGSDPEHPTAEWLGREAVDLAPSFAIDAFAPEVGLPAAAARYAPRLARFAGEGLSAAYKGALGGAAANPDDRKAGAQTGTEIGAGGSMAGQIIGSRPVHRALLPAAVAAEVMQHGGMLPHGTTGGLYPWALAHGLSALAGLARAAGVYAPSKAGAIGSQVQQYMDNSQ